MVKKKGIVYLVGAGPGDPGLLTVRAAELLQRAEVIAYDRLLHPALLRNARPDAELIDVGKVAGFKVMSQENIGRLLVARAKEGKMVVRLKGGDPFIFGRGGEEALDLVRACVAFEIVPGVTSAIAVPAYAGIPVTFRNVASSCSIVTGHEDPTKGRSDIDWDHLANGGGTLVILMGTKALPKISARLIQAGRKKTTACAVISHGTYAHQKTVTGTLENIAQKVRAENLPTPAILVVGEVVRLRNKLRWFDKRPLFGKTIVVTRAREQASDLLRSLEELGAQAYQAPTIRIVPPKSYAGLDAAIRGIQGYDWIFFTSVNGVKAFGERLQACKVASASLRDVKIAVIGPARLAPLKELGLKAHLIPKRFVSEGIIEAIDAQRIPLQGKRILLARAEEVRDFLAPELRKRGAIVEEVVAYKTVSEKKLDPEILQKIRNGSIDWITFTSSSTVKNFFGLLDHGADKNVLKKIHIASIGPITSQTLRQMGYRPAVEAKVHTIPGLVDAIINRNKAVR